MVNEAILKIVRCPIVKEPLRLADDSLLARLNQAASSQALVNRQGETVEGPIQAGLVNHSGSFFYRIDDDIPNLIADDAIPLAQLTPTAGDHGA